MTAFFGAVTSALVLATSGVLVALINRSDRHVTSRLDGLERRLEKLETEMRQGFATLSLRIEGLYGRSA